LQYSKYDHSLPLPYAYFFRDGAFRVTCTLPGIKFKLTWSDNKVRELIAVKVLHTSKLNTTVVAFKVLHLGSDAPMPAPSQTFKTILELVLWNGLQSCCCITPDVINIMKMPSFQYFLYLWEEKKSHWWLETVSRQGVPTQLFV